MTNKEWREELRNLRCVNGALYFGTLETPCPGRDTGECCLNEQSFEEATNELENFIQSLLDKQKEKIIELVDNKRKVYKRDFCVEETCNSSFCSFIEELNEGIKDL